MPTAHLADRACITVSGGEAEDFLQNILTIDLAPLAENEARPGALLSPQGKILFDFLISRLSGGDGLRLECRADIADEFIRRLTLYRLRAKVEIGKQDQEVVAVSWRKDSASSGNDSDASHDGEDAVRDMRFPLYVKVLRYYAAMPLADADAQAWQAFRIENGVAESGGDYALGDAFPHDVLLDQMGGVGFRKGCYVGQEVVSRMQHRGTARRRVLIAEGEQPLAPEAPVIAGGRALGNIGSIAGRKALAIVRIDRVKEAMDAGATIEAGGVPVSLSIPEWAGFAFPANAAAADEA